MNEIQIATWMQQQLNKDGCLYQDDVVDYIVKQRQESLLRENAEGNLALGLKVLNAFKSLNEHDVVWVIPDKYWRFRVPEDDVGRNASG
ncbi:hypothetical protein [Thiomicrorhabdus sp. Kp2]|uniref:DUF6953 family protein n=1 Tax=Thiomicrorhabdus sp. Kp2 TaxID=1123518 RepID=UPI0005952FA6|nr:hypothetical protein [Thiomicrorhabdus sp. Kp2]